jgi:hypothetical protein
MQSCVTCLDTLQFFHLSTPHRWGMDPLVSLQLRVFQRCENYWKRSATEPHKQKRKKWRSRPQTAVHVYLSVVWIWCRRLTRTGRNTRVALRRAALRLVVPTKLQPEPLVVSCRDQVTIRERFPLSTSLHSRQILQVIVTDQPKTCSVHIIKHFKLQKILLSLYPEFATWLLNKSITCNIWGFHCGDYEEWCLLGC